MSNLEMLYNYTYGATEDTYGILEDDKIDTAEVDQIIKIIGRDGVVDKDEYVYVDELMSLVMDVYFEYGVDMMSDELMEKLIDYTHENYVDYAEYTTQKYPELARLGHSLPVALRDAVDYAVMINGSIENTLRETDWRDLKLVIVMQNAAVGEYLKRIQEALPSSPYKADLTKIYETELRLLQENQRKVQ
ncbi:MAG: hypothetical protein LBD62_02745 [Candidatus Margulisbacteria bacterium]|nr:hypothetical protein [Candidatus Margulisiibacteriota bacterium]